MQAGPPIFPQIYSSFQLCINICPAHQILLVVRHRRLVDTSSTSQQSISRPLLCPVEPLSPSQDPVLGWASIASISTYLCTLRTDQEHFKRSSV